MGADWEEERPRRARSDTGTSSNPDRTDLPAKVKKKKRVSLSVFTGLAGTHHEDSRSPVSEVKKVHHSSPVGLILHRKGIAEVKHSDKYRPRESILAGGFRHIFPISDGGAERERSSSEHEGCKELGLLSGKPAFVHNQARAKRNWRVMRTCLMAIGLFKLAGLNRQRAKELSAAEVKRGLRGHRGSSHNFPVHPDRADKAADQEKHVTYEEFCDQYVRFCPASVLRRLHYAWADLGEAGPKPDVQQFWTTLFFADISGFTRLSARLNAEQLKTHTNNYFTMLMDVVARYGGDIIKFCGDAVMILWPCEYDAAEPLKAANAVQASECAMVMLRECGLYDVGRGDRAVSLRLHCGIGAGSMYGYTVGAEGRWEYLVAGDPLRQIGEAESEATQGQVIVAPEAWALISGAFAATKTPRGNFLLRGGRQREAGNTASGGLFSAGSLYRTPSGWGSVGSPKSPSGKADARPWTGSPAATAGSMGRPPYSPTNRRRSASSRTDRNKSSSGIASEGKKWGELQLRLSPDSGLSSPNETLPAKFGGTAGAITSRSSARAMVHQALHRIGSDGDMELSFNSTSPSSSINSSGKEMRARLRRANTGGRRMNAGSISRVDIQEVEEEGSTDSEMENSAELTSLPKRRSMYPDADSWAMGEVQQEARDYLGKWIEDQYSGRAAGSLKPLSLALRGFCQESARFAIESGTEGYLAQLRKVTTIFINIVGLEEALMQGELFLIQQVMEVGVTCFGVFGGVVRQFVVDDKGCVMIAAFGLPQYSYEDNEVRAVAAAQDMIKALRGLNLEAGIGITAGTVYCGFVGAEKRCEYAMMGASVNLSARLMAAAPSNSIRVDGEVSFKAQKHFNFECLEPIKAKGYMDPVPVFSPVGLVVDTHSMSEEWSPTGASDNDAALQFDRTGENVADDFFTVGQKNELSQLREAVSRVAALATLEVVVLLGQSGSGKTHLLSSLEVQKMKKAFDLSTVQTHCRSVHTATPYYTWRSILVELISLDLQEADSTQEGEREGVDFSDSTNVNQAQSELPMRLQVILRESENVELLGEEFTENLSTAQGSESGRSPGSQASHKSADLALNERVNTTLAREVTLWMNRHLPDMADLTSLLGIILECESSFEGPVVMPINVMDPEARYRKLEKLMLDILAHVCQRCSLMLVVENVQWMDTRSLKLLHKVARKGLNLLLVLSTRPLEEYFETIPRELISLREMGTTIEMEPLTADESLELCRWHIGPPPLPAHDALQPHASGEILVQKSGGNPLFVRNIAISLKEEAERGNIVNLQDLPTGFFNDLIVSRFDALEPMEQTVLKAASVIGTTFSMKLVLHMLPDTSRDKRGLLHAALIKLIGGNFISRTVVGKTERFNFVHGAVQETIYRMMLVDQREALHEVCAAWYEQHYRNSMTYTSLITHHWLRSANTSKKVERLLRAANHAKATFSHEETIKHFSALVALAFARPPSISSIFSLRRYWDTKGGGEDLRLPQYGFKHKIRAALGRRWRYLGLRRRQRKQDPRFEMAEALGARAQKGWAAVSMAKLTPDERAMLYAKENCWLHAGDFVVSPELAAAAAEPNAAFSLSQVGHWIGEIGLAYMQSGRLYGAYNHMQEGLLYLGFQAIPEKSFCRALVSSMLSLRHMLMKLARCGMSNSKDAEDVLMAARLYEGISSTFLKMGHAHRLPFVQRLAYACTYRNDVFLSSPEHARLLAHFSVGDACRGKHRLAAKRMMAARTLSKECGDVATQGYIYFAAGTHNAGLGFWDSAEASFGAAFEIFAPLGNTSKCGEVMIESAFVKMFTGEIAEAESMFREVREMALRKMDRFLITVSLDSHAMILCLMGRWAEAAATVKHSESYMQSKWSLMTECMKAHIEVVEGNFTDALRRLQWVANKFARTRMVWFSVGFYLHFASDALFTMLEYNVLPGPEEQRIALQSGWKMLKRLAKLTRIFDMGMPLLHLARARWLLLHGRELAAEAAVDAGLHSESTINFPYAQGLLLLHSTRLQCLGETERRARARRGRSILQKIRVGLITLNKNSPHPCDPTEGSETTTYTPPDSS